MSISTAIKAIEDAIVQRLIDTAIPEVLGIVYNRELRWGAIKNPYIRIFPTATPINDLSPCTIREDWNFRFTIMGVAATYKSEDYDQAREVALKASSAMMWDPIGDTFDRTLIVGGTPHVEDIVRQIWHAEFTQELPNEILFGAAVEMEARKILQEV